MAEPRDVNDRAYIHEFIDIRGHHRAEYMHHMTANWSPLAQETRMQNCFGVWATLGSTGRWPEVVNMWEEHGLAGLASSFGDEAVGPGAQDPVLERWWAKASEFRRGGLDRIMLPAPWSPTIDDLCADGVRGACYAHDLVSVRPGRNWEYLELARVVSASRYAEHGWTLAGAFVTAMVNADECLLLWAIPTWNDWAEAEDAESRTAGGDGTGPGGLRAASHDLVTARHRILLVDAPLSPMRTGRQPHRDDRTDWTD